MALSQPVRVTRATSVPRLMILVAVVVAVALQVADAQVLFGGACPRIKPMKYFEPKMVSS